MFICCWLISWICNDAFSDLFMYTARSKPWGVHCWIQPARAFFPALPKAKRKKGWTGGPNARLPAHAKTPHIGRDERVYWEIESVPIERSKVSLVITRAGRYGAPFVSIILPLQIYDIY